MYVIQSQLQPAAIRDAVADLLRDETDDLKVASAYVTSGGTELLLQALRRQVGAASLESMPKVLVAALDFGLTEPSALEIWQRLPNCQVRVAGSEAVLAGSLTPRVAFHPKIYLFGYARAWTGSLVGSANLTSRGFSSNTEAAWSDPRVPRREADVAFAAASRGSVPLTGDLLATYAALRRRFPPPREIAQEVERVPAPRRLDPGGLPLFRDAVERGDVIPASHNGFWVHVEKLQGGSGNQLELPRGAHRFFGFHFADYEFPDKKTIGTPILFTGARVWQDRLLTWHGNNRMERMNLPTLSQGGFVYDESAVMFRRHPIGFELIVAGWESDLARSWREASATRQLLFRLGQSTGRLTGFI